MRKDIWKGKSLPNVLNIGSYCGMPKLPKTPIMMDVITTITLDQENKHAWLNKVLWIVHDSDVKMPINKILVTSAITKGLWGFGLSTTQEAKIASAFNKKHPHEIKQINLLYRFLLKEINKFTPCYLF